MSVENSESVQHVTHPDGEKSVGANVGQLVVYGSTGRTVLFCAEDLVLPKKFLVANGASPWYEREWDKMKGIWMRRVNNEPSLQVLSLSAFIDKMVDSLQRRRKLRQENQKNYHKRKRLLNDETHAGHPCKRIALANLADASEFEDNAACDELVDDVVKELQKFGAIFNARILPIDEHGASILLPDEPPFLVVVEFATLEEAVTAVVATHGRMFGGRHVRCFFYSRDPLI